jgi:hypothetical protein
MTKHDMLLCVSRVEDRSEDRCSHRVRKTGREAQNEKKREGGRRREKEEQVIVSADALNVLLK